VGIGSFHVGSLVHESVHGCTCGVSVLFGVSPAVEVNVLGVSPAVEVNVLGVYKRD
jgi:hypothetical protein